MNMTFKTSLLAGSAAILALTTAQAQETETVEAAIEATVEATAEATVETVVDVKAAVETAQDQAEEILENVAVADKAPVAEIVAEAEVPTEVTVVEQVAEVRDGQEKAEMAVQKAESISEESAVAAEVAEQVADVEQAVTAVTEENGTEETVTEEEAIKTAAAEEEVQDQVAQEAIEEAIEAPIEVAVEEAAAEAVEDSSENVAAVVEEKATSVVEALKGEVPAEEALVAVVESPTLKPVQVATTPSDLTMGELLNLSKGQFSKADLNGDGALSESEFVSLSISLRSTLEENYKLPVAKVTSEMEAVADAQAAATTHDVIQAVEGNDDLIEEAAPAAETQIAEAPKAVAGQAFADLSEQTNSVTEDKVVAAIIASFEQSDTDNNNTIEAEELAKFAAFYAK